jgi:hypothetical protein
MGGDGDDELDIFRWIGDSRIMRLLAGTTYEVAREKSVNMTNATDLVAMVPLMR